MGVWSIPRGTLIGIALAFALTGCAHYVTPGAGANIGNLASADGDIAERMKREPAASFPVRLAVARIQASGYSTYNSQCYGAGQYCVVTTRDIETEQDFDRLSGLPMVAGVAPISRILLPDKLASIKDIRLAAASLKADMALVYSIDTRFTVESTDIGPLAVISLGFLPNKNARVTSTASAALFDVRTGFVYGATEATATESQRATMWSTEAAIDSSRMKAEADAFQQLLGEFESLWKGVVETHAQTSKTRG
jgi:hypothetical protein